MEAKNGIRSVRLADPASSSAPAGPPGSGAAPNVAAPPTPPQASSGSTTASSGAAGAGGGATGAGASSSAPLRSLEHCIRLGLPVVLEDVGEGLMDPAMDALLTKAVVSQGAQGQRS